MPDTTLAEQLRAYMDADKALASALEALDNTAAATWGDDERACYLRGHDDALRECEDALHGAKEANDALTARVRELETVLDTAQRVHDEACAWLEYYQREMPRARAQGEPRVFDHTSAERQAVRTRPAAVGVAGVIRWGRMYTQNGFANQLMMGTFANRDDADKPAALAHRVVAIVDPDAIVPLASAVPACYMDNYGHYHDAVRIETAECETIQPLYFGLAQHAQEGE